MKKFLLWLLFAGLMLPAVAQKNSNVVIDGWTYAGISKSYDRQTQNAVYPMTKRHNNGFIGCTWTNEDNPPFTGYPGEPKHGIGYSYSTDGGETWSEQDNRAGGIPLYCPSYAQWGANGEAILGRSPDTYEYEGIMILNGLVLLTRENKGQGAWTITPVPYPAGTSPDDDCFMAWARMATSGDRHQYIHIMSPMRLPEGEIYKSYYNPVFYYRTQADGLTWDIEGELVPEMIRQEWDAHSEYIDAITFADTKDNTIACAFIAFGQDGYVLKSLDNGGTWTSVKFFDSPIGRYISLSEYADTCFIPTQGCIALDYDGEIYVAFSVVLAMNDEEEGNIIYFSGFNTSFLSYWNEGMVPIDGATDFAKEEIEPLLMDYFDWELSDEHRLYVKSSIPKLPIIGYFTAGEEHYFYIDWKDFLWQNCYGITGNFSFPQMGFDVNNNLHLAYLGLSGGGQDDIHYLSHPFYTKRNEDGIWTQTEYIVDNIDLIDREFAYLTLAGIGNSFTRRMYLMAQVDGTAGTYIGPNHCQVAPTDNYFYYFHEGYTSAVNDIEKPALSMSVVPNPASGQATVRFEGKGAITVYNMLGQMVYHIENVENEKIIPLDNMPSGVYFVTVRSGNAIATQKLVKR